MWSELAARLSGRIAVLEPLDDAHEDVLWRAASVEPAVWDWMTVRGGDDRGSFANWFDSIRTEQAARRVAPFAVLVDGVPTGHTSFLNFRERDRSVEIGHTWLSPSAWRSGANAEAKYLLLRRAFDELGLHRVEFKTDAQNDRARRALEAIPAQFEGIHRKHMIVRGGERRDSAWYSVLDDEWPEVRRNLERRIGAKLA